jgi:ferredoxin
MVVDGWGNDAASITAEASFYCKDSVNHVSFGWARAALPTTSEGKKAFETRGGELLSPTRYLPRTMADAANKYSQNAPGAYYVDDQCIDCDLCRETAPANFKRDDDGGHSYLYKQPESDEERNLCEEALTGCPVEAIGRDGE